MLRLMLCFVRQQGVAADEFRGYWRSGEHHEKIASLVDLFAPDYHTDTLALELSDIESRFRRTLGRGVQYDAVVEFFWKDPQVIRDRLTDKAVGQILRVLRDQSVKRVDPDKTTVFFTEAPQLPAKRTEPV